MQNQYVSGKTGTTDNSKDRWYCGYTDYYTAAVWTGYNVPEQIRPLWCNNPAAVLWNKVMAPLHSGLEPKMLFDWDKLWAVDICLDSGLRATDACRKDVRGELDNNRVDTVYVYYEDRPTEYCDKHVEMEYCPDGDGVANEWCKHFASDEYEDEETRLKLEKRSLCKVTQEDIDMIFEAKDHGIWPSFLRDDWAYLVDERGRDVNEYKGINGELEQEEEAPYKVCTVHTEEKWEEYLESIEPEETEPTVDPNAPTDPNGTTDPTTPNQGGILPNIGEILEGLFG